MTKQEKREWIESIKQLMATVVLGAAFCLGFALMAHLVAWVL